MNEEIRKLFPAVNNYTYLNSAAVSPMPVTAVEAVSSQLRDVAENGSINYNNWIATKKRCRELVAELLHVKAEQIAFMRNTSDGISTIANGLIWNQGDNIVTFAHEFPSNYYPWRRLRDEFGVELRTVSENDGRIDLDKFISLIDEKTKVVSISAVQFSSGFRADLEKIGKVARKFDALFVVDIIQAFGAIELNLEEMLVDAACGASHKWLCSPEGCGIIYLGERAGKRIKPTLVGWVSVPEAFNFNNYEQDWKANALAWETGTSGISLFYGLEQSLTLLKKVGIQNIQNHLENLSDYLCKLLKEKNYEVIGSREKGEKSQIVCILPKNETSSLDLAAELERKKIVVSPRGERIRIAPHFFNNQEDIENFIGNLP